jgi:hypothetical protein
LDTFKGGLQFDADGTITGCRIKNDFNGTSLLLQGTNAAVISNSYIENANSQIQSESLLHVQPASGSHNRITDNQFVDLASGNIDLLSYFGGAGTTDVVAHNTFVSNMGSYSQLYVNGTQGLTVQGNTFTNYASEGNAIELERTVQDLQIVDNIISLPNGDIDAQGLVVIGSLAVAPGSVDIANNHISTGGKGYGMLFWGGPPGSNFVAMVQGNDLNGNAIGVSINSGSGAIDLGGGSQGSMGANNFRGDPTAIYVHAIASEGPISAQLNIFAVPDPTTVIHDQHNDPKLAAIVSSNALTGNAAFVETLYLDFLHRIGNLSDPKDAGIWVTRMGQGMPAATVANLVARSPEALGVAVEGLYHRFLGRDADTAGRANFVAYLQAGGSLEGVSQILLASPEYQARFPTDSSYVQSLYQNLLHRPGGTAEINGWLAKLPQLGRAGVAQAFLLSQEYRADEVGEDYTWFLHRTPSTAEVNSWVNSGKDFLTIDALFAGTPEFQANG